MIIKSILDTDLYKFTTSYAYMKLFSQARGTFEFIDRDNTEYPEDFIERLYLELGSLGMLHLTKDEQEYMNNNCRFIPPVYWEWLSSFKFNSGKIQAFLDENGHLHIKVTDYLYKVTLYEVPILAIVSELRSRIFDNNCDLADVIKRLSPKIKLSNVAGIKFSEFGIGTNLTNDTGFKPANIVMKLTSCQMNSSQPIFGCVKLSDDAGKHTGKIEDV